MSNMQRIRDAYGVPAKRGMVIKFQGHRCVVTSASRTSMHLNVRSIADGQAWFIHPTREVEYPPFPEQLVAEARVEEARQYNRQREADATRALFAAARSTPTE